MKAFRIHQRTYIVWTTSVVISILAWASLAQAQTVTWQALPFPSDSDWPGPQGSPAIITANNEVIMNGQPVRTVQTFTPSLTLSFDTFLSAKTTGSGYLALYFMPTGIASNLSPYPSTAFVIDYNNPQTGQDDLTIQTNNADRASNMNLYTDVWTTAFSVVAGVTNHVAMTVGADGALGLTVDGQPYSLPNSANVPFTQFQMELWGWQPGDTWHVLNFTAVPEPSTVLYVGMGLTGLLFFTRRPRCRSVSRKAAKHAKEGGMECMRLTEHI